MVTGGERLFITTVLRPHIVRESVVSLEPSGKEHSSIYEGCALVSHLPPKGPNS